MGIDHIVEYYGDSYSVIPTIGALFLLNFASATIVTAGLLAPVRRPVGRWADSLLSLLAMSGMLLGLFVAVNGLELPSRRKRPLSAV